MTSSQIKLEAGCIIFVLYPFHREDTILMERTMVVCLSFRPNLSWLLADVLFHGPFSTSKAGRPYQVISFVWSNNEIVNDKFFINVNVYGYDRNFKFIYIDLNNLHSYYLVYAHIFNTPCGPN